MSTALLIVKDLRKVYSGGVEAVKGVSFSIEKPSLIALLGPNGAGKTTLLNMIVGVLPPTNGEVYVLGKNPWREREARRLIGFVPQELGIRGDLTVYENLVYIAAINGVSVSRARLRARELMESLGLFEYRNKLASKLSGGLKRRLSIAMSLIHDPQVLVLDEPTTGLDPGIRVEFIKMLKELVSEGKAVLLSTHISEDAEYCDEVIIMDKGVIVAKGSPEELKRKTVGLKTIVELVTGNPDKAVKVLKGGLDVKKKEDLVNVYLENAERELPRLFNILLSHGIEIYEARIRKPTISDVFLLLTGHPLEETSVG